MTVTQAAPAATKLAAVFVASALFFGEGPLFALMLLAANVAEEHRIDKAEQAAIMGVRRDHWMQVKTVLFAIVAQGRGILDREDVTPLDQPSGARAGGRDHLFRSHTRVTQEARNTHLAGAIATHPTHADA